MSEEITLAIGDEGARMIDDNQVRLFWKRRLESEITKRICLTLPDPIVSMLEFQGKVLVATSRGVYRLVDPEKGIFERLCFVELPPETST